MTKINNAFNNLEKTSVFLDSLNALNNITPLLTDAKTTNLSAINNLNSFFYNDDAVLTKITKESYQKPTDTHEIKIGDFTLQLYKLGTISERLSFRIIIDNVLFPKQMHPNRYLIRNNMTITEITFAYLYSFSDSLMTDTYISYMINILNDEKHLALENYLTYFIETKGYQLKPAIETMYSYVNRIRLNDDMIYYYITNVLSKIYFFKNKEYLFNHGSLNLENIVAPMFTKNPDFQIRNFHHSSLFFHGIRFCNVNNMGQQHITSIVDGYYSGSLELNTCIPVPSSYDIYFYLVSLLMHPSIFNYFSSNQKLFQTIYQHLFDDESQKRLMTLIKPLVEKNDEDYQKISQYIMKEKVDNISVFIFDLMNLKMETFDAKYQYAPYYKDSIFQYSTLHNLVYAYYSSRGKLNAGEILKSFQLRENIDLFYQQMIQITPKSIDIVANLLPYKRYDNRYFQLSTRGYTQTEYHLCIDKCQVDLSVSSYPTCRTNKYISHKRVYDWDNCIPGENIYEYLLYKIISRIMFYYDQTGKIDEDKLNNDPNWRILIGMMIHGQILVPHFNCQKNFIINGKQLGVHTASRSIQFINVELNNMYQTLNLHYDCEVIDQFIDNIIQNENEKFIIKPILIRLINNIVVKLKKQVFAKVNGISDAGYNDTGNIFIQNESKIYQIADKLLNNNNTPNISSLLLSVNCNKKDASTYNNYLIGGNKLENYFNTQIKYFDDAWSLESYQIFLLELLKENQELKEFLEIYQRKLDSPDIYYNLIAILIQIAYTLDCFYRIGLVHNDLHYGNVFIEELGKPINLFFIITDATGENIIKVFNIQTKYFVRIFDFDQSYTIPKNGNKHLTIKFDPVPRAPGASDISHENEAQKYDFSYVCRWIYYQTSQYDSPRFNNVISQIIGEYATGLVSVPVHYKRNMEIENDALKESMSPFEWLSKMDVSSNNVISISTRVEDLNITNDASIYIYPDANLDMISNHFDQNTKWTSKTFDQKINICGPIVKNIENALILNKLNSLAKTKFKSFSIDWVRHGESCANLDQMNHMDKNIYSTRSLGYQKYHKIQEHQSQGEAEERDNGNPGILSRTQAGWKYEPNLTFIGIQHAIKLGIEFIQKQKPYDVVVCSPLTRTIMTAMIAFRNVPNVKIYVVPYISEIQNIFGNINYDFQNTAVSSKFLKKRILFVKDWLEQNWIDHFDDIEIMTDLIDLREYLSHNKFAESKIISQINEAINCKPTIGVTSYLEPSNKYTRCLSRINLIKMLLSFMSEHQPDHPFYVKYQPLAHDNFTKFKRGAPVDFEILEKYEQIYQYKLQHKKSDAEQYNTRHPNIYKFYTEILPQLGINIGQEEKVCSISHGSLIRKIWSIKNPTSYDRNKEELKHMRNTAVYREKIDFNKSSFKEVYHPELIRSEYQNFEALNTDICRTRSLKGILNYNLREPPETTMGSMSELFKNLVVEPNVTPEKMSHDVKIYQPEKYEKDLPTILRGGLIK